MMRLLPSLLALLLLGAACGDNLQVGAPCRQASECPSSASYPGDCVLNLPNGYCTRTCNGDADCDKGSFCLGTAGQLVCVKTCTQHADCRTREGYTCIPAGPRSFCGVHQG